MHLGATVVPCTTPHVYSVQRFAKIRAEWLVSRDSRAGARCWGNKNLVIRAVRLNILISVACAVSYNTRFEL
ncbi:hypothetical protein NC651_008457 [Populus alba x Populus x berolinensis]|nr:hypothetical protein NC651_008457 [Populus alba x Populus x berolinensis]